MTRLALLLTLAAGCATQSPSTVRAPQQPRLDVSRICENPQYSAICTETQAPSPFPATTPVRVDTNLSNGGFAFPAG